MNHLLPSRPNRFFVAQPGVLIPPAVEIIRFALAVVSPDHLRNIVRHASETLLAGLQCLLGPLPIADIEDEFDPKIFTQPGCAEQSPPSSTIFANILLFIVLYFAAAVQFIHRLQRTLHELWRSHGIPPQATSLDILAAVAAHLQKCVV